MVYSNVGMPVAMATTTSKATSAESRCQDLAADHGGLSAHTRWGREEASNVVSSGEETGGAGWILEDMETQKLCFAQKPNTEQSMFTFWWTKRHRPKLHKRRGQWTCKIFKNKEKKKMVKQFETCFLAQEKAFANFLNISKAMAIPFAIMKV